MATTPTGKKTPLNISLHVPEINIVMPAAPPTASPSLDPSALHAQIITNTALLHRSRAPNARIITTGKALLTAHVVFLASAASTSTPASTVSVSAGAAASGGGNMTLPLYSGSPHTDLAGAYESLLREVSARMGEVITKAAKERGKK